MSALGRGDWVSLLPQGQSEEEVISVGRQVAAEAWHAQATCSPGLRQRWYVGRQLWS